VLFVVQLDFESFMRKVVEEPQEFRRTRHSSNHAKTSYRRDDLLTDPACRRKRQFESRSFCERLEKCLSNSAGVCRRHAGNHRQRRIHLRGKSMFYLRRNRRSVWQLHFDSMGSPEGSRTSTQEHSLTSDIGNKTRRQRIHVEEHPNEAHCQYREHLLTS
jgi:hypothetical protein